MIEPSFSLPSAINTLEISILECLLHFLVTYLPNNKLKYVRHEDQRLKYNQISAIWDELVLVAAEEVLDGIGAGELYGTPVDALVTDLVELAINTLSHYFPFHVFIQLHTWCRSRPRDTICYLTITPKYLHSLRHLCRNVGIGCATLGNLSANQGAEVGKAAGAEAGIRCGLPLITAAGDHVSNDGADLCFSTWRKKRVKRDLVDEDALG